MARQPEEIFSIGHSTRTIAEFIRLLKAHSIELLVDIRTVPRSRFNPQFDQEALRKKLGAAGIGYIHLKGLGGLRKPSPESVNKAWRNASFRGFADYMQTRDFAISMKELILLGKKKRSAIMCAEGNPFRCHRSLVADALLVRKVKALEITGLSTAHEHVMTAFAVAKGKQVTYP